MKGSGAKSALKIWISEEWVEHGLSSPRRAKQRRDGEMAEEGPAADRGRGREGGGDARQGCRIGLGVCRGMLRPADLGGLARSAPSITAGRVFMAPLKNTSMPWQRRRRWLQVVTGTFPCGQQLVKYGYKEKAECTLCKKAHEENESSWK